MNLSLCMKMNVINIVMLLLILQYMLIFVVRGEKDLTCQAGYGIRKPTDIRTSGSQCSGLSKITTEAECKLAAEYNSKNNIDKNGGFGGRLTESGWPPGCVYSYSNNKYYWNDRTTSTRQCSNKYKCVCKAKICTKCSRHSYSKGGINVACTPCPTDRPYTFLNSTQDSINSCTKELSCQAGEGSPSGAILTSGDASQCSGLSKITTEAECKAAAEYNSKNNIDKNDGYGGRSGQKAYNT